MTPDEERAYWRKVRESVMEATMCAWRDAVAFSLLSRRPA